MGVLYARVGGVWQPVGAPEEVFVGPGDPGNSFDLWYDTDDPAPVNAQIPAGGAAGQALVKVDGTNFNTTWGSPPRPANVAWGVMKRVDNGGSVVVPTTGPTYLHAPLVFTFIAGRQYRLNWHFRAVARTDNAATDAGCNMGLYDGTTSTGWVDTWYLFRGQWNSWLGSVLLNDSSARSLRLGFGNVPTSLTIYPSQVWLEDIGPVAT